MTDNIINDYNKGLSWKLICNKYNINTYKLSKILHTNNVILYRSINKTWDKEKINLFINMYNNNYSYKDISNTLKISKTTIVYWINKLKLNKHGRGRNNNYINKFLEFSTESNYWLGYILADGHIHYSHRNKYLLLISSKDYVVNKFKLWYDNIPHIYTNQYNTKSNKNKILYTAYIGDSNIVSWFYKNLNVSNKKLHNLNPNINITWDIIRGYFDVDGSASKHYFFT